ncbi:MAG: leucine-rich repeat domain-containing protein [Clostridia bacterium]|nr:leucine-rich repeat domain-containing protein [Clostridia bacterium]
MKRTNKLWLALLLTALLLLGTVATGFSAVAEGETIVDSGYCGAEGNEENASWALNRDGTLTISGEGEVYGRVSAMGDTPWTLYNYGGVEEVQIQQVIIEPGITNVPAAMCLCNSNLTHVEIPDTVTHIDEWAFYRCSHLSYIDVPDSVTTIGASVFQCCDKLLSIRLPEQLSCISQNTFLECKSLESVIIPKSVTLIKNGAFKEADRLSDVYFSGSEEEWNNISVQSNNDELLAATIHFISEGPEIGPSQPTDNYNWQPIPTSPDDLAEGDWYLDFTDFQGALNLMLSMAVPGTEDDWYFDEDAMVLKVEGVIPQGMTVFNPDGTYKQYPETMVKMEPDDQLPGCMEYFVYRFLNRVGQSWVWLSSQDPYYSVRGYRIDYPALARQVIAADDRWSDADYDTVLALVREGEWIADLDHGLLKGCYGISTELTAFGRDQYRFVLPSAAFFAACVTDEPIPVPEISDLSSLSGQWGDTISWTLEDGTLTISGTGELKEQINTVQEGPIYSSLYYNWEELSFRTSGNGYGRSRSLLQDEINNALCAHFDVVNPSDDSLEQAIMDGRLDPIEAMEYYYDLIREVKTVVIEEGITSVNRYVLSSLSPQKLVLPASMTYGNIELNLPFFFSSFFDVDIYIANPEADFTPLQVSIPAFSEAFLSLASDEITRCAKKIVAKQYELMAEEDRYDSILKELFEVKMGINSAPPYYPSLIKTCDQVVADWNARTGSHYTSADDLIADCIAAINALYGTDFTAPEDLFYAYPSGLSACETQAYQDAKNAYWDREAQELFADDPNMEVFFHEIYEGEHLTFSLGQAIPASEDGTVYCVPDWITIHGYPGSTAETAAATSGVKFAPYGTCGDNLVWTMDNNVLTISGTGAMADYTDSDPAPWMEYFADPDAAITVLLEEGVTRIGTNAFPAAEGLKEMIVLNKQCDLSSLVILEPAMLRGYLDSTAEAYGNAHEDDSLFEPLCPKDYHHTVSLIEEEPSTCIEHGHEPGVYCDDCEEVIYGNQTRPLTDHTWSEWSEKDGVKTRTCSVCKKTQQEGERDNFIMRAMRAIVAWLKKLLSFFG